METALGRARLPGMLGAVSVTLGTSAKGGWAQMEREPWEHPGMPAMLGAVSVTLF